ncbi:hypothetical protein [Neisseria sp. Ec49-e6-T10]|uniref:hypothetical protein n=1 Tax=Neisseria sp. Ec49-e6-T10 TaxID=3140744 RepID=UPI003EBF9CA6
MDKEYFKPPCNSGNIERSKRLSLPLMVAAIPYFIFVILNIFDYFKIELHELLNNLLGISLLISWFLGVGINISALFSEKNKIYYFLALVLLLAPVVRIFISFARSWPD